MKRILIIGVLLLNLLAMNSARAADTASYTVLASIRPIALLVQELAGKLPIKVETLLPEGATIHDYALSPGDVSRIRGSDLMVWLGPVSEPYLRKLMAARGHDLRWDKLPGIMRLPAREALHTDETSAPQHDELGLDPHIWWSVPDAIELSNALVQRIGAARPQWKDELAQNAKQLATLLRTQLVQARKRYAAGFKPFLLAHDAFFYLEEDLGIRSEGAIMLDPEAKPGVRVLLALKRQVEAQHIRCVLTGTVVPASLIDKVDTNPPLVRVRLDELAWDYKGDRYSQWLKRAYAKVAQCVGEASD